MNPIQIAVEFLGADEASDDVDDITKALDKLEASQDKAAAKAAEFSGKFAAAAGQVRVFADAIGNQTLSRLAQFAQRIGASAQAGVEFGRAFGPQGALVGGIIGAALPALEDLLNATDAQAEASQRAREAAEQEAEAVASLTQRLDAQRRARSELNRLISGGFRDAGEAESTLTDARSTREMRQQDITRLEETIRRAEGLGASPERIARLREQIVQTRAEIVRLQIQEGSAEEFLQRQTQADITSATPERRGNQRRASPGDLEVEAQQRSIQVLEEYQERLKQLQELREQNAQETARLQQEERVAELQKINDIAEAEAEAMEERKRRQDELRDDLERKTREGLERAREQAAEYKEVTDVIVGGLTDALASIIDGSRTAEQAFLGLLSSFLGFIAEKAALSAAEEAAQAIAAYARYDYGSGAQHTAAAVAFGAVAIAAGAGSAAAGSAAAGAAKGAGPERGRSGPEREGGGGSVVINWNSPVVTAQSRAELGRELSQMVNAGQRRFG